MSLDVMGYVSRLRHTKPKTLLTISRGRVDEGVGVTAGRVEVVGRNGIVMVYANTILAA